MPLRHPARPAAIVLWFCTFIAAVTVGQSSEDVKTLVLSVADSSGKPVLNVAAGDLHVLEDGVEGQVLSVKRASGALFVQLLVDTTPGIQQFVTEIRSALLAFVQQVRQGDAEARVALMDFGQAAVPLTNWKSSDADVEKSIKRLFPKPNAGAVLLEALAAASNQLASRPSRRRAIVALNIEPSDEQSGESPRRVHEALRLSGAQVWSLSLQTTNTLNARRDSILHDVTRLTGGRRDVILSWSALPQYLTRYADLLLAQYEVEYRVPGGKAAAQLVQIGTTRSGVRLHASAYPLRDRH